MYQKFITKFNNISFNIIIGLSVLLPLFFLPASWSGVADVKGVLLYIGVFLAFSFWLLAQFVDGSLKIPKHSVLFGLGTWTVLTLISALVSTNSSIALWGRGFVTDSFSTVLILSIMAFLISTFVRDQKRLVKLFLATFSGSVFTILLQILFFLFKNVSFVSKYFPQVSSQGTLVGSWIDFTYFVIFTFLLSLLMHEVLRPKGFFKTLSIVAMAVSMIALIFLNFKVAWVVTTISALLVFVYKSSVERSISKLFPSMINHEEGGSNEGSIVDNPEESTNAPFPIMSFAALLLGLFFFLSSNTIGSALSQKAGINFTDIRPSFGATTQVMKSALAHNPLFGSGAGHFNSSWNLYHPLQVNQTIFWNSSFDNGFNMIQTVATTNGLLASLALLAILVLSLLHGFKLFNSPFPDRFSRFISVAALVMLLVFTSLFVLASPGIVLVTYGFLYIGILVGVSTLIGRTKLISIQYLNDPRLSFFAILMLVVATMVSFSSVFFSGNKFASIIYYNKALTATDPLVAQQRLDRALTLSVNDIYWRARTQLFVNQFTYLAAQQNPDATKLQNFFTQANQSANAAVASDKNNSLNWLNLSQVYQLVITDKDEDAYNNAKKAADEAQRLNPKNPVPLLNQAQIALTKSDTSTALDFINKALDLKSDYLDAYILRGRIRISKGESQDAMKDELNKYIKVAPFDEQGYTALGQLDVSLKDYQGALAAFSQARNVNPSNPNNSLNYINTLIIMGQKSQAIEELKSFKIKFPSVTGVDEEISKLSTNSEASVLPLTTPEETPTTKKK